MRKMRFLAVALLAVFGITAVAFAQSNSYDITAKVPSGGSKKKPKAGGFKFNFTIADPAGNIPSPVKSYSLGIEGSQVNTKVAPSCTAASINNSASQTDEDCNSKAKVGSGEVKAVVGTAGQPMSAKAGDCTLALSIYNGGGTKAAIYLEGGTGKPGIPACLAPIHQAIDAKWVKKDGGTALVFEVPEGLRHQVGLDVPVISETATFKNITKKINGKKRGYFESIGCKDGKRTAVGTFTDETGTPTPIKKDVGKC